MFLLFLPIVCKIYWRQNNRGQSRLQRHIRYMLSNIWKNNRRSINTPESIKVGQLAFSYAFKNAYHPDMERKLFYFVMFLRHNNCFCHSNKFVLDPYF